MANLTERFEMRLDEVTLQAIDKWRREQGDMPSRSEAIRRLIERALAGTQPAPQQFSAGEQHVVLMLRDIMKHLKVKGDSDPDFLQDVICGGHYWALPWQCPGINEQIIEEADASFVSNVMEMWTRIEEVCSTLAKTTLTKLAKDVPGHGNPPRFRGFDGNCSEGRFIGIARLLIDRMDRFEWFKDRDLNSHFPMESAYRRMLQAFDKCPKGLGVTLNLSSVTEILKAGSGG